MWADLASCLSPRKPERLNEEDERRSEKMKPCEPPKRGNTFSKQWVRACVHVCVRVEQESGLVRSQKTVPPQQSTDQVWNAPSVTGGRPIRLIQYLYTYLQTK